MDSLPPSKRRRQSKDGEVEASTPQDMSPVVIFAHGAGAPSSSDWKLRWKTMLKEALHAADVVTFDYPYMAGGKKRAPPKAEKLVDFHANIVKDTATKYPGHPLILAGKSMGSRVECMVASMEDSKVSAVVCLGYPLEPLQNHGAEGSSFHWKARAILQKKSILHFLSPFTILFPVVICHPFEGFNLAFQMSKIGFT